MATQNPDPFQKSCIISDQVRGELPLVVPAGDDGALAGVRAQAGHDHPALAGLVGHLRRREVEEAELLWADHHSVGGVRSRGDPGGG